MINRLLSNLPFNPSLIEDVSFYVKRLKQEESVRRTGVILVVLSMFVQVFAAMVPPEKSVLAAPNDVISGGVSNIGQLTQKCKSMADVQALYLRFGLECNELDDPLPDGEKKNQTFNFKEKGKAGFRTVGRVKIDGIKSNQIHDKDGKEKFPGGAEFFSRNAGEWPGSAEAYYFGRHLGPNGGYFEVWILKDCGNIAYVAAPGGGHDEVTGGFDSGDQQQTQPVVVCNRLTASQTVGKKSLGVRFTAEYGANLPNLVNGITFNFGDGNSYKHNGPVIDYTYTNDGFTMREYVATVVINSTIGDVSAPACSVTINVLPEVCETNPELKPGDPMCDICPHDSNLALGDSRCKPPEVCKNNPGLKPGDPECECPTDSSISAIDPNCGAIGKLKKVTNVSQKLDNDQAIMNKVKAGDILEYSLITTNTNYVVAKDSILVEDFIGDILDYMNLDEDFLKTQGGTFNKETKIISWASQTIPANGSITNTFRVTAKSPFPSTNQPNATAPDYDCKIQNGYGNEIMLGIECPALKTVETLPNTGPGTTVGIAFVITVISGYFFARSRLLAKELDIIKKDYSSASL